MSQENVEAFERALAAYDRRDVEAVLEYADTEIELCSALDLLVDGTTVFRGHQGVRDLLQEVDRGSEFYVEVDELRDLGDRVLANGRMRGRGMASGVETESPISYLVEFENGKAIRVHTFLDHAEALEAAGLRE
jgi:ketosteroid isomerase-like protein